MSPKTSAILGCVLLLTATACVRLTPGGERVQVRDSTEISGCELLGHTTSQGVDKVLAALREFIEPATTATQ